MIRHVPILRCQILFLVAIGPIQAGPALSSLQISSVTVDMNEHQLRLTLSNAGTKVITAYALRTDKAFASVSFIEDFFPSIGVPDLGPKGATGSPSYVGGIRPGDDKLVIIPGELSPRVTVTSVVFDDRTSEGSPEDISRIASRRAPQVIELSIWCEKFMPIAGLHGPERGRQFRTLSEQIKAAKPATYGTGELNALASTVREQLTGFLDAAQQLTDPTLPLSALSGHCNAAPHQHELIGGMK
jgi:hypothetical protein